MTSDHRDPSNAKTKRELAEIAMHRSWFPVARSADLATPQQATLLGTKLVVFRRADGVASVLRSRCPHRGGSFTIGKQHGNDIACSYHGWRFSGETGTCTLIPSLEDQSKIPPKARVKVYPAVEKYGHVWTVLDDPICDMYDLDEWRDVDLEWLAASPLDSPTGVAVAIENFRDVAHFPFVHRATMGDVPEVVEPLNVRRDGLDVWMDRELLATEGEWNNDGDQTMRYHCVAPGLAAITFTSDTLGTRVVAGFPSPIAYDHVKIFWGVANEVGYKGASLGHNLELEQRVYLEDLPIAERLEPREVPWDHEFEEFSVPSDLFTLNYRRAFNELMTRVA